MRHEIRSDDAQRKHIYDLLRSGDPEQSGAKAFRLAVAGRSGVKTPPGFVLEKEAVEALQAGEAAIVRAIHQAFDTRMFESVAVRSSASVEDSADQSFAGVFRSILDVQRSDLCRAILEVSRSGRDLGHEQHGSNVASGALIPVVVQAMVKGNLGGVAFSCDPVTGSANGIVEYSSKGAVAVTSGSGPTHRATAERQGDGTYKVQGTERGDTDPCMSRVAELVALLRNLFEEEVDVEWTVDQNEMVVLLQVRPIILPTPPPDRQKHDFRRPVEVSGTSLSPGRVVGRAMKLDMDSDPKEPDFRITAGDIVVAHSLRLDQLALLREAAGLVLSDPSLLSHVAIRAREMSIPAVGGVPPLVGQVPEGCTLEVDGTAGVVRFEHAEPKAFAPEQPPHVFFDPWELTAVERGLVRFVASISTRRTWIYCEAPFSPTHRDAVLEILESMGLDTNRVVFDYRTLWPSENSPSIVFSQYTSWQKVNGVSRAKPFVDAAIVACNEYDTERIRELCSDIVASATSALVKSIMFVEAVENGDIDKSEIAAMYMDEVRLLFGELLGTVILDVLCARSLASLDTPSDAAATFLEGVSRIKNHELTAPDSNGRMLTEFDVVDRFYRSPSLRTFAESYRW
ncbi:MAG: hypothetical protein F4X98_15090 [Gammaproteobacteria bacterium]|nr:hypothetical protein [Gammaproteobacteria bacterium]